MEKQSWKYLVLSFLGGVVVILGIFTIIYYNKPDVVPGEPLTCKTLLSNGDPEKMIDIVFFFDNIDEEKAQDYINHLLDTEPFKANKEKFNFYSVNAAPSCEIQDGILVCYSHSLIKSASVCPNEYIIVLSKKSSSTRSSAYINLMSLNIENPINVIIHEFGHVFANLADEYTPSVLPRGSKNCVGICEDFKSETDGCFKGCTKEELFRSIENGAMRTLKTNNYGKFDIKLIEEDLTSYG